MTPTYYMFCPVIHGTPVGYLRLHPLKVRPILVPEDVWTLPQHPKEECPILSNRTTNWSVSEVKE